MSNKLRYFAGANLCFIRYFYLVFKFLYLFGTICHSVYEIPFAFEQEIFVNFFNFFFQLAAELYFYTSLGNMVIFLTNLMVKRKGTSLQDYLSNADIFWIVMTACLLSEMGPVSKNLLRVLYTTVLHKFMSLAHLFIFSRSSI